MSTPVLLVTASPEFGDSVRAALEQTDSYRVFVVSGKVPAIVRAEEESCRMAILDLDLGERWVENIGQALRKVIPEMKLFVLTSEELPPALDRIRPWTLVRKPFQLPQVLVALARPSGGQQPINVVTHPHGELPWLSDVNAATKHIARLAAESSSQAALIVRDQRLWAYAGALGQAAIREVAALMSHNWDGATNGDLLRFARLDNTSADHVLYATRLAPGVLLGLIYDAETPVGSIRAQVTRLGSLLVAGQPAPEVGEAEVVSTAPLEWALEPRGASVAAAEVSEAEDDDYPVPQIQNILGDVPPPEPEVEAPPALRRGDDATRRAAQGVADAVQPGAAAGASNSGSEMAETVVSKAAVAGARAPAGSAVPEAPDYTLPHSLAGFAGPGADPRRISLEPLHYGVYHLTYACLLLPRFPEHFLTGEVANQLSQWMPILCIAFGWRLEYLAVRPDYLQWVSNVPPATSPAYVMRVMRTQTSEKIFAAFPALRKHNPSGDFWAPGYLIMGGTQPHPSHLVRDYIRQVRQRQGHEKPKA